jgi:hypothetical protein
MLAFGDYIASELVAEFEQPFVCEPQDCVVPAGIERPASDDAILASMSESLALVLLHCGLDAFVRRSLPACSCYLVFFVGCHCYRDVQLRQGGLGTTYQVRSLTAVAIKRQVVLNAPETKSRHTVKRDG